ncbi:MAG: caspase family protein [Gammaproteobacteria bacterium]
MNLLIIKLYLYASIILIVFPCNLAFAENYALLVGIGDYNIKPLAGPKNDVTLMKSILMKKWSFNENNITLILNEAGTKKQILAAIKNLYTDSKSGDNIFIYFSGHGTSASDKSFKSPLPTTSGALIPIDIDYVKNKSELIDHLIIGRKDLRPLLKKFDNNDRHVFVAIDACYSGNTVRGLYKRNKLDSRYLNPTELLPNYKTTDETVSKIITGKNSNSYPYKNIYYLSASGEYEPAQEIKSTMLSRYPTIDGKPHGAFSDTLLRVLNNNYNADSNHDGLITYSELKNTIRYFMRIRGFDHTPHGLPSVAEDQYKLATRGIFGLRKKVNSKGNNIPKKQQFIATSKPKSKNQSKPTAQIQNKNFKIVIDKSLTHIKSLATKIKNINIVPKNGQLELRKLENKVLFISHSGDLILQLHKPSDTEIINNIKNQLWINNLIEKPFNQDFNIDLDMFASGRGSTVAEGDTIGVAIKSSQSAHILIININPLGTITVLYPYTPSELNKLDAYKLLAFKALSKVVPPFGREYIQVYAFKNSSSDYQELMAKSFQRNSPDANKLMRLLEKTPTLKARASLEVVTVELN